MKITVSKTTPVPTPPPDRATGATLNLNEEEAWALRDLLGIINGQATKVIGLHGLYSELTNALEGCQRPDGGGLYDYPDNVRRAAKLIEYR